MTEWNALRLDDDDQERQADEDKTWTSPNSDVGGLLIPLGTSTMTGWLTNCRHRLCIRRA
jgi:hypothetical protein